MTLLLICLRSTENERLSLRELHGQEETEEHAGILEKWTPGEVGVRSWSIQRGRREEMLVKSSLQP
jgi:hypothetical protein